ncbi:MAG: hypothetical protein CTY15_02435 [Methylocystis sp.]|nr:MAG: hypothetical protein CTY15_02435 [Methylocystis sp.]
MMRIKILTLAIASGALALGAPMVKAMPVAKPALDTLSHKAHGVRICDDDGDCWWSYRHHRGRHWDDDDHWRRGERFHDRWDGRYGRAPHRDFDRDRDRDFDKDRERQGRNDRGRTAREEQKDDRGGATGGGATTPDQGQTQGQGKKD